MTPPDPDRTTPSLDSTDPKSGDPHRSSATSDEDRESDLVIELFERFRLSEDATRNERLRAMAKLLPLAAIAILVIAGGTIITALTLRAYLFTLGTTYLRSGPVPVYAGFALILAALLYVLYGEASRRWTPFHRLVGVIAGCVLVALPIVLVALGLHNPLASINALVSALVVIVVGGALVWWGGRSYQNW